MPEKHLIKITPLILAGLLWGVVPLSHGEQTGAKAPSLQAVKQQLAETGQVLKNYSAAQRDKAVAQAREGLKTLDNRLDALQLRLDEQWDGLSESARTQARSTLAALQKQRNEVAEWYGGMKYGSSNAWDRMKQGFSQAYQDLSDAWAEAEQEFDRSQPPTTP